MHQLPSSHMSGVRAVRRGMRAVLAWCTRGAHVMPIWGARGACLGRMRCLSL